MIASMIAILKSTSLANYNLALLTNNPPLFCNKGGLFRNKGWLSDHLFLAVDDIDTLGKVVC